MKAIFSRNQHFTDPVLGHTGLNKAGLHLFRLQLASLCFHWRRLLHTVPEHIAARRQLAKQGYLLLPNFLPPTEFSQLQQEIRQKIARTDAAVPIQYFNEQGFGEKHAFDGGFDRYDGTTLNRFYQIQPEDSALQRLTTSPRLLSLLRCLAGMKTRPEQLMLYKVIHGAQQDNPDIQKDWHRDTFQPALKMWYFTEDVTPEQGPFEYIPASHRLGIKRLRWEQQQAVAAAKAKAGGSFRIDGQQACQLHQSQSVSFAVPANSLVVADIRGFHRRSTTARQGEERISLYANFRPHPFKLW